MNPSSFPVRLAGFAVSFCLAASSALAVSHTEDPLALVSGDAASVGVVHWNALRDSPLAARVFSSMDGISADGDGGRFLRETGLSPREDIDTMVVALTPGARPADSEDVLVVFEGRFDLDRIAAALTSRGATRKTGGGGDAYFRLPGADPSNGAVALVNRNLVLAGTESAVRAALVRKNTGGEDGLMSGRGLGQNLKRVDMDSSAWALVDFTRLPAGHREAAGGDPATALVGAMKSVTLLAVQATVHGDSMDVAATGVTADAENRGLLEDSLRGALAMWRMAVQEKSPELVSVLRRFQIDTDGDAVSIRGTLPESFLRALAADHRAGK